MEQLKVSKEYLKAYNHADMICTHMPHMLDKMETPKGEPSEYTKGFKDRIKQHEIEKDAIKNFSYERLKAKYGRDIDNYGKERTIDKDKT